MFFRYGAYQHPDNEVLLQSFEQIPVFSERGLRKETLYRMSVTGDIIADGQAAIASRITELVAAYAYDGRNAALYHDDGTITRHAILNDAENNLTGTRILHRSWPRGDPGEYATFRHFAITFGAVFRELDSQITRFREEVRVAGTAGPRIRVTTTLTGPPRAYRLARRTPVTIVQSGFIMGFDGVPDGALPGPLYPALELVEQRRIERISGTFRGRQTTERGLSYSYTMLSPESVNPIPNEY